MPRELTYTIYKPRSKIKLNLAESEKYESAVIVQQLVGNLIYYSNMGRYEPRIAKSWSREKPNLWKFYLRSDFKCENGEVISPTGFKKSIERQIFLGSKQGEIPIFGYLVGINKFLKENQSVTDLKNLSKIDGIIVDSNSISFEFDRPIKTGVLQLLSFSPFGYISLENYDSTGNWRSDKKFISSGPYIVAEVKIGERYKLERNTNWPEFAKNAPDSIIINHEVPNTFEKGKSLIIDAFTQDYNNKYLKKYSLVPEYINSILLGNLDHGYFSSKKVREKFKNLFSSKREVVLPSEFGPNSRSNGFYPNQIGKAVINSSVIRDLPKNELPLLIEGKIPLSGTPRHYAWLVLQKVLEENSLSYKFSNTEDNFSEMIDKKYDIRIRGSSIGGGVEAWGLFVSFCSPFGINFPDPSGRVCELIKKYDKDKIDDESLTQNFLKIVEEDAAILPVSHYGIQMFLADNISQKSISPTMSIVRFDQLEIVNEK